MYESLNDKVVLVTGAAAGMHAQQRSGTVDIMPPSDFPKVEDL